MLRKQKQVRTQIHKLLDAFLFALSFWFAHLVRDLPAADRWFGRPIQPFSEYAWLLVFIVLAAPLVLELQGFYGRPLLAQRRVTAWHLFKGCVVLTVGTIIIQYFLRDVQVLPGREGSDNLSRSVYAFFGTFSFILIMLKEEVVRRLIEAQVSHASLRRRLIIAGSADEPAKLREYLEAKASEGFDVVEEIELDDAFVEQLPELLHKYSANAVVLCARHTVFGLVEKAIQTCELEGVEVWLMADFFKTEISQTSLDEFYGKPMLVFRSAPEASWQAMAKQVIDFGGAALLLAITALPMALVALGIRFTSPGPVLFRQQRAGLNGRPFYMYKFRSMVNNAEQLKQELAQLNEMSGPVFKVTNDPRITPIGRFIRKWSIDELPQLWNVVRGDMSLVGPRPLPVDEVDRFDDRAHRRRLSVKPGLTCLWQVSGRNNVKDFKDWVRLDLEYIDNWTIWLDLKILARTVPVVLAGTGAR
jgi:exopolysaccharide biosynthesis polyprenyl glycosylphosphotransferase